MVEPVRTNSAPQFSDMDLPISQAVIHNDTIYVAGQVGLDPVTGEVVEGGIRNQTIQSLDNIASILEKAGSSLDNVIKSTIFIEDMDDFDEVNAIYSEYVSEPYPARSAIEVEQLAGDFIVEIEVIAAAE